MITINSTPGPWHVRRLTRKLGIVDDHGYRIAKVERIEDANLISAAPNCYAILDAIQKALLSGTDARIILDENSPIFGEIREAMAKARGEL